MSDGAGPSGGGGGQFQPGNPGGPGGARPNAGRKPLVVKQVLEDLLFGEIEPNAPTFENLILRARTTIAEAMDARNADDKPTATAARTAIEVWRLAFGRPKQMSQNPSVTSHSRLAGTLDQLRRDHLLARTSAVLLPTNTTPDTDPDA